MFSCLFSTFFFFDFIILWTFYVFLHLSLVLLPNQCTSKQANFALNFSIIKRNATIKIRLTPATFANHLHISWDQCLAHFIAIYETHRFRIIQTKYFGWIFTRFLIICALLQTRSSEYIYIAFYQVIYPQPETNTKRRTNTAPHWQQMEKKKITTQDTQTQIYITHSIKQYLHNATKLFFDCLSGHTYGSNTQKAQNGTEFCRATRKN